jgi:cytochrome P450
MPTVQQAADRTEITDPAAVREILLDPGYVVPHPGRGADFGTVAWLRQHVARFSTAEHYQRRQLAADLLGQLDPGYLRGRASQVTRTIVGAAGNEPFEVMSRVARPVPVMVLADSLHASDAARAADAVSAIAPVYQPGSAEPESRAELVANVGVAQLISQFSTLLPPQSDDAMAARIGLLVQAHDATAVLIGTALLAEYEAAYGAGQPALPADGTAGLVARTLRGDPPARWTRRVSPAGELVWLSLACAGDDPAGHLAFGHGPRYCPGAAHAQALAVGVLQALLEHCQPAAPPVIGTEPPRVPTQFHLVAQ